MEIDYVDCMSLAERVVESLEDDRVRYTMLIELLANHYESNPDDYQTDLQEYGE